MSTLVISPICIDLNVAVQVITARLMPGGFDIDTEDGPQAPDTYKKLCAHVDAGHRMLVSRHGLDGSIYDSREINAAGRAWHDWHHYHSHHDFSILGERATFHCQAEDIRRLYGASSQTFRMCEVLKADIVGQSQYYNLHRRFVKDQKGFVNAYLINKDRALLGNW